MGECGLRGGCELMGECGLRGGCGLRVWVWVEGRVCVLLCFCCSADYNIWLIQMYYTISNKI